MGEPWWKSAVIYQIYPRSFADSTGSGVGDLQGIQSKLDYLVWLGVDAVWLSPFFRSPMCDFGYDVSDHCAVDPLFGTLADFDALIRAAHERGLRVLIDWVPAHTSSDHPWFEEARSSRSSQKRDWYVWRDPGPRGELPNNWTAAFPRGPAWTLDPKTEQLYLHSFLPEQPDLNWNHPGVVAAMHDVLRFWLDRGVDGFRADVVHNIGKPDALADVDPKLAPIPHCALNDEPLSHEHLRGIRRVLDAYEGDRVLLGEVFLLSTEQVAPYYGKGDELHLSFNFPPLFAAWTQTSWRECIQLTSRALDPVGAWPTWVLSNHDQKRHRTRYGSEACARAAAVLLLTLRGTPVLYMGEELGLEDAEIPESRALDPGGRDGCRAPIPWTAEEAHGWGERPWLPFPPAATERSVECQRAQPASILHLYRRLLGARRGSVALREGELELLDGSEDGVLLFRRSCAADERLIAINFCESPVELALGAPREIELASDGEGEGQPFPGKLRGNQAVVLR